YKEEREYIKALEKVFESMIEFGNAAQSSNSVEEINSLTEKMKASFEKSGQEIQRFITDNGFYEQFAHQYNQNLLNFFSLRKRSDLWIFTEKMRSYFFDVLCKTRLQRLEKELSVI